ncbi:protein FAR1-RELATED SEQUENCE 5-like isoform X2 [Juglans regia]|uniref:Protein FAR1-RELATED SEQUENCE 5-like isoform X2 n=1 Tax=Juglans regia TaxID=51240 RepID=A0A6P9EJP8_JUGRE|nr:protein FAR1-RELATED SEQUENCE 5-like isoform X2 [Juglans regia]XP_035544278.1 protein FAR1-RELATED SEQUENCE 5-like isoform X2 [Juglans regia]XP_035545445.1 protein FAR1-RELATED SEQUENCE 5-like isoform X2 [Juglans regia]
MEKGEESTRPTGSATRPTSSATRPASSTAMTQEIPRPFYPDWSAYNSYMHGYHGMMPPTFFPPFAPRPNADPYSWRNELPTGVPFRPPIAYPYAPPIPYPGCSSNSKDMTEPSSSTRPEPSSSTRRSLFSSESNTYEDSSNVGDEDIEQEQEFDNPMVEEVPSMVEEVPSIVEEVPSSSHGNDDDGVIEPRPGMSFKTEHELLDFYKKYGKQIGFGVMTQRSKREDDGSVRYLTLGCARGGKARNRTSNVSKPRPTTKTDCKAKINAIVLDGVLRITTVDNAHNHGLSPRKARFFRCNRAIDASVKRQLDINDKAGISMAKSFNSLVVEVGGYDNLPFVEKDARNYIDKARHLRLGKGGADALRGYFERMQYKNDGFYSLMDLDDEGRLKNVFWADARSRSAYGYFGDVVTFDTTYLTNRYGMPFAPFVGVNHHGQSILFGAGLISSEDTDTFVWLFETWLKCMDKRAPNAAESDHFSMDMTQKLLAMNLSYTKTKAQPVIVNVGTEVNDVEMGSSKKVLSPRIVRGKGRPPSKRLAPTVEKVMRKQQTKRKQSETGAKRKRKNAPELQDEVSSGAPTTDEVFSTSGVAVTTDEVLITSGVQAVTDEILNTSGVQAATTDEVVFPGTQQSVISQVDLQHG